MDVDVDVMTKHIRLKHGDNDNNSKWGGNILSTTPDYAIKELQSDLKLWAHIQYQ
tara:strand:+ start:423 stop:587 length:165 start_codon:yes stop_codon:yes gene_type:complete